MPTARPVTVPAPRPVDHAALAQVMDEYADTVTGDFAVEDILRLLVQGAARVLDVDGAGVMAPHSERLHRLVYASSARATQMEQLQESLQDGPCRQAHDTGEMVSVVDLAAEGRWPAFQRRAGELGLHAVAAIPLRARDQGWGVLDLYRASRTPFSDQELAAARTLAHLATSYLVVTSDRDSARAAQDELAHRAMHDPLTGLPVRWVLLEQLAHALARLERHPGHLAVLFLDLDHLKEVNDTFGHAAGDRLMTTCVERMRAALRPADVVARVGGDEFVVLLEEVEGTPPALRVAERILTGLAVPYLHEGATITPSASIGVVVTAWPGARVDDLVSQADAAMYRAKQAGRGRYELFDPTAHAADRALADMRRNLLDGLQQALPRGELCLHYQPVLDLTGASGLYAVEALLRWQHPQRGLLAPGSFLDVAEAAGLVPAFDAWVLGAACRQLAAWDRELGNLAPQRLFVNLTAEELAQPGLPGRVAAEASAAGIAPSRLTLEVTETALLTEPGAVRHVVQELRAVGCELAIDDFGAGWSCLGRLVEIPASVLKVDRSFARDLAGSPEARAVVDAVLLLGRSLRRTVIVEGVEDEPTLRALRGLGCTHVQGFHLARPQDPAGISALARS